MNMGWDHDRCVFHLIYSSVAGTTGAIVTCPLEVVKTRQQSSRSGFVIIRDLSSIPGETPVNKTTCRTLPDRRRLWTSCLYSRPQVVALSGYGPTQQSVQQMNILHCLRHIVQSEGPLALFKGKLVNDLLLIIKLLYFYFLGFYF